MQLHLCALLCALLAAQSAAGYHILAVFSVPSKSHNHLGKGFVNALLNAGHEVTWVTPYPPEKNTKERLHIIDASAVRPITENVDVISKPKTDINFSAFRQTTYNISETTASLPALQEAMLRVKFDAVVTEFFFSEIDAGYAAALRVPWIMMSGTALQPNVESKVDEVRSAAIVPLLFNDAGIPMSFLERFTNVALYNFLCFDNWWHKSVSQELYEKLFGAIAAVHNNPLPPLEVVANNVSVLFLNSHPSLSIAQSMPPNAIEIAGYHIEETVVPLPKDLEAILDASTQGVIYFSMGSVLKSSSLPEATKTGLLKMFAELPYTVLWKVEKEMTGLPKNVHTRQWMPQAAILAHKNTRVFITHGGFLSNLETIRYGIPTIAVPVFGDQLVNAARAVRAGYALLVPFETDTMVEGLRGALKEALGTDKYYKRAKYLSSLFNNRPIKPEKLIAHYVEIAIESKGAYHLRSKAPLYSWYQRAMLDILGLILVALFIVYTILKVIIKVILSKVFGSGSKSEKKNKQKKN